MRVLRAAAAASVAAAVLVAPVTAASAAPAQVPCRAPVVSSRCPAPNSTPGSELVDPAAPGLPEVTITFATPVKAMGSDDGKGLGSDLQDARFAVAAITASALAEAGHVLRHQSSTNDDETALGLSTIASMAGETGLAALQMYQAGRWYAGAALTRQLVEHHYLCAYFAQDLSRVATWLSADEKQLKSLFAPARLRDHGGFSKDDYKAHCTWGGHPNPRGTWLVGAASSDPRRQLLLLDLAQHLAFIYTALVTCIGEERSGDIPGMLKAFNYIVKWRRADPLALGLPVGRHAQGRAAPAGIADDNGSDEDR